MCKRERLLAKRWRKVTFHPSFWGHDRNHYFNGVLFTKYRTMSICYLSFQRSNWTEIQLVRFDGLFEGQKASTSVRLSPTPASIDYVIWSASSTGWKLRAFVQSKFKMKRTSVKPGFMYIDELLWNLGLSWWHENLGRIEPCRVVWVEPCRVV